MYADFTTLDIRIDHARIYTGDAPAPGSGNGAPFEQGASRSIGIAGDRIVLNVNPATKARRVIDATGLACCPGFIDIHSHSDYAALYAPTAISKTLAGFTTELNGNCGYGAFPLAGPMKQQRQAEYQSRGLVIDWETVDQYFERARSQPMALNQGLLIGQGTLRGSIMGMDNVEADRNQRRAMHREVERAMRMGCFGLSTGLVYAPGSFAQRDEIVELARIVADHGGVYASHLRSESDALVEALDEFLGVCEEVGCRAQYSHVKTSGRRNWHKLGEVRRRMDEAKSRGVELFADRYPYTASCTDLATILLPNEALAGGHAAILARLKDRRTREELKKRIRIREQLDIPASGGEWFQRVMIGSVANEKYRQAEGATLARWARTAGESDPLDAAFDLIIADDAWTDGIHFSMSEDNLREILRWPEVMIGSDACLRDEVGSACKDHPHPRAFGTPARVLGQLCRDAKLFDLPTAIHKMTGLCARVMRLKDRGLIREGYLADLVLLDPRKIRDCATYERPTTPPEGIAWVFVNGVAVVSSNGSDGPQSTRATPGSVLTFAQ